MKRLGQPSPSFDRLRTGSCSPSPLPRERGKRGCSGDTPDPGREPRFPALSYGQRGFTLLELIVAVGVLSLIVPALVAGIYQISRQTVDNSARITAITPLENAGRWLGRDIPLAHRVTTSAWPTMCSTPPLVLYWTDWSDTSNYDSYSATGVAYKRVSVTYCRVGSDLRRTVATCANKAATNILCNDSSVVAGTNWAGGAYNNTRWVSGQAVLDASGNFRPASRETVPTPAPVAQYIDTILFSQSGNAITVAVTTDPRGLGRLGERRTYQFYGALLSSEDPF